MLGVGTWHVQCQCWCEFFVSMVIWHSRVCSGQSWCEFCMRVVIWHPLCQGQGGQASAATVCVYTCVHMRVRVCVYVFFMRVRVFVCVCANQRVLLPHTAQTSHAHVKYVGLMFLQTESRRVLVPHLIMS